MEHEFAYDCPEVTLCGWQDVKIHLLTNKLTESAVIVSHCAWHCLARDHKAADGCTVRSAAGSQEL